MLTNVRSKLAFSNLRLNPMIALRVVLACVLLHLCSAAYAFERDFHYYTVYLLLRTKGHAVATAQELAGFSQYVDDNLVTEPLFCSDADRAHFHFAGSGKNAPTVEDEPRARAAVQAAFVRYANPADKAAKYVVGAALHLYADSFSHQGFTAWWVSAINHRTGSWRPDIGHADDQEGGHYPDRPYNRVAIAVRAARAIYELLPLGPEPASMRPFADIEPQLVTAFTRRREDREPPSSKDREERLRAAIATLLPDDKNYDYKLSRFENEAAAFETAVYPSK